MLRFWGSRGKTNGVRIVSLHAEQNPFLDITVYTISLGNDDDLDSMDDIATAARNISSRRDPETRLLTATLTEAFQSIAAAI